MIKTIILNRVLYMLIFLYLNEIIYSYKIIDINDLPIPKLAPDSGKKSNNFPKYNVKRFKDEHYDETIDDIQEQRLINEWNEDEGDNIENNNYRNKILVKRIVPHAIAPTGVEYDHKFGTVYNPLVRVHKTKSINQFFKVKPNQYDTPKKKSKHESFIFVSPKNNKLKQDMNLLSPFKISKYNLDLKRIQKINKMTNPADLVKRLIRSKPNVDEKEKIIELVKKIQKKVKNIKSESKRVNAYVKVINAVKNILRSPAFEKSGEENDPLAPGRGMMEQQEKTKAPKKWIPHYPSWNYWTYKKTIHEDVCPGTQVRIANMCIWTPPH